MVWIISCCLWMVNACFLHGIFINHFLSSMDGEDQFEVLWGKRNRNKKMFDVWPKGRSDSQKAKKERKRGGGGGGGGAVAATKRKIAAAGRNKTSIQDHHHMKKISVEFSCLFVSLKKKQIEKKLWSDLQGRRRRTEASHLAWRFFLKLFVTDCLLLPLCSFVFCALLSSSLFFSNALPDPPSSCWIHAQY